MSDLNRQIAEALGWRCEHVTTAITVVCKPPNKGTVTLLPGAHVIFNPEGEALWTEGQHYAPERAWDYALKYLVPNWSEDAVVALALCGQIARERGWCLELCFDSMPPKWAANFWISGPETKCVGEGDTPALALAHLALAALTTAPPD